MDIFTTNVSCFFFYVYVVHTIVPFFIANGKADLKKVMNKVKAITGEWAIVNPNTQCL